MALYSYQAFSKEGKKVSGSVDASSIQSARDQLSKMGLLPTSVSLATSDSTSSFIQNFFKKKIKLKDKIFFTKQLGVLLKSGIPLVQALDLLVEQTEGSLKDIVIVLRDGIKEGRSLGDGLEKYPNIFENIYVQLVRAGEATGKLNIILDRLTEYLERRAELKKKVSGALRNPIIQIIGLCLVVSGILIFVIPKIEDAFSDMGENFTLPFPTRLLINMSNFLVHYYYVFIIAIILIILVYRLYKRTPQGGYAIDKFKLKLPIVGYFAKMGAIVQFCRTLGMLVESGVNLAESLSIVVKIMDNKVLIEALEKARENIIRQGKIAQYLKETNLFPPVAIYLINTGEQSGQLDSMLLAVAKYYEDELRESADGLAALISPIMLMLIAGAVVFILLSIMLPIQNMSDMASKMS